MPRVVVYDACVLYPASLRDLLLRLAVEELCRARWSNEILDEVFSVLRAKRPDLDPAKLEITRARICEAVPECLVTGHLPLVESLVLPDPLDRHVLAAAIHSGAEVIVTENRRDFPARALRPHGIEALSVDDFVLRMIESAPEDVRAIIEQQAADLKNPPYTADQLLKKLSANGLKRSVARLRRQQ
ncbi:MAG: PIN domain-containing protein [Thermoanaerobaculia bacterium]|nr:PIN domain-containing protein [Thermoanaerobaculia bacterium]